GPRRGAVREVDFGLREGPPLGNAAHKRVAEARGQHGDRLAEGLLGREPGELRGGAVEELDLAGGVDGDDAALDRSDDAVDVLVREDDPRVELRVLDRHARLV